MAINDSVLPDIAREYFRARSEQDYAAALALFHADAQVTDDGREHVGLTAIANWIEQSSTEFSYTSTPIRFEAGRDQSHFAVVVRVEGNFPGGSVVLRFSFGLVEALVAVLIITAE